MNNAKLIGICNRIRVTPKAYRGALITELVDAIDEGLEPTLAKSAATNDMRTMLDWPEVKASPLATARIARNLRSMR